VLPLTGLATLEARQCRFFGSALLYSRFERAAIQGLTDIDSGLNIATPAQVSVLSGALPIVMTM
jgi:hypothetical protein